MAEVRMVPGKVFVAVTTDGEVKQVPGKVFFTEEAAVVSGLSIPVAMHSYRQRRVPA